MNCMNSSQSTIIKGARVIDGTGCESYEADVIFEDEIITDILPSGSGKAREVIDATGKVLCPGFIDSHTHDDLMVLTGSSPHPKLSQGVTTVVIGNCGISLAPLITKEPPAPLDILGRLPFKFDSFREYLEMIDSIKPAVNVVPLIGHTTLRVRHVLELQREAKEYEIKAMQEEIKIALDYGAFGLSTGVYYPPARAASIGELMAVSQPLTSNNSILAMHIRDEGDDIDRALREALEVGHKVKAKLVLSHHKVVGKNNFGRTEQTLNTIDLAAQEQSVCLDCYPYEASSTMLSREKAERIENVIISWSQPFPECAGRTLKSLASEWGISLGEAASRLMPGGAIYFGMSQCDVDRVLAHPLTMIGSDGLPHDNRPHPRLWGTFPRVLGHYVRERKLLSLERAIYKMTGLPARRFGIRNRGVIAPGMAADIMIFDPKTIRDNATYENPSATASGIEGVWVNGQLTLWNGRLLNTHAGYRLIP